MKHTLRIMTPAAGDLEFEWQDEDEGGVAVAEEEFSKALDQGMAAFRMDTPSSGELIREFDPTAELIIMSPAIAGG